jgi:hypothetical protein
MGIKLINGYGYLTIDSRRMPDLKEKWVTLLNTPVASDKCKCRPSRWRSEVKPCNGAHKTLYENEYVYDGGETLEQYSAYNFEDIASSFGYEVNDSWVKNDGDVLNYRLSYKDQNWQYDDQHVFLELLEDFCKDGDSLHFEGSDEERWIYLYKDGTFTAHFYTQLSE